MTPPLLLLARRAQALAAPVQPAMAAPALAAKGRQLLLLLAQRRLLAVSREQPLQGRFRLRLHEPPRLPRRQTRLRRCGHAKLLQLQLACPVGQLAWLRRPVPSQFRRLCPLQSRWRPLPQLRPRPQWPQCLCLNSLQRQKLRPLFPLRTLLQRLIRLRLQSLLRLQSRLQAASRTVVPPTPSKMPRPPRLQLRLLRTPRSHPRIQLRTRRALLRVLLQPHL